MRWHSAAVACVVVILLLEVRAASAQQPQQQKRGPQVHRMVIYNGPMRTVTYFGRDLSESDKVLLKDMGQAESDPPPPVVVPVLAPPPQPIPVVAQSVVPFTAVREVTSREVGGAARLALARARVAASPILGAAFGFEQPAAGVAPASAVIRPAAVVEDAITSAIPGVVVVTMQNGRRIECRSVVESGQWVVVTTTAGRRMRLNARDVMIIEEPGR